MKSIHLTLLALLLLAPACTPTTAPGDDDDSAAGDDDDDATGDDDDATGDDDDATGDDDDATGDDDDDDATGDDDDATGDDDDDSTPVSSMNPREPGDFDWTTGETSVGLGLASAVPVTTYIPSGITDAPVVVFHHGFQLAPVDYVSTAEHLASWGYVVVLPNLPAGVLSSPTHAELDTALAMLLDWVEEEATSGGVLGAEADAGNLALAGHSLGGKITLLRASYDSRPDVVFAIDPVDSAPPFGGSPADYPSVAPERMSSIDIPLVILGETTNATGSGFLPACAPEDENFQQFFGAATSPALEVEIIGANHMSFVDNQLCLPCLACTAGTDDPAVTRSITQGLMVAFFERELRDDSAAAAWLAGAGVADLESTGMILTESRNGF